MSRTLSILAAATLAAGASFAASAGPGHGGGGGGGGGHAGGGGHTGGGGHFGGGAHYSGGGARFGGYSGGAHFQPRGNFVGSNHGGYYSGAHYAAAGGGHFVAGGARAGYYGGGRGYYGHGGWNGWGHGYVGGSGRFWGGGYWGGRYWPGIHYGLGFAWFFPVLPIGYATYWWGGVPYYYYDNAYYMWNPSYNGYIATDPPPVATSPDAQQAPDDNGTYNSTAPGDAAAAAGSYTGGAGDIYVYPKNGQSDEQTSNDRFECHKWAVTQTGFDPTQSSNTGTAADYRRAIGACLDARGYSVK